MNIRDAVFVVLAILVAGPTLAEQKHIPRETLEEMFKDIQQQTKWDLGGRMLWGYFFTGPIKVELERLGVQLVRSGYRKVDLRKLESDHADPQQWQLHVEQVEIQTVQTLFKRNLELEQLAGRFEEVVYDGMDVGPTGD